MSAFSRDYYDPNHPGFIRPEPAPDDASFDAMFWCECGDPISQDPETEKKERAAGMCILCIAKAQRS